MENIMEIKAQAHNEGQERRIASVVAIAALLVDYARTNDLSYVGEVADAIIDLLTDGVNE